VTDQQESPSRMQRAFRAAELLAREEPDLVTRTADELRRGAESDIRGRLTRSRAYVRRLQELSIERPELAIAVSRRLDLGHIVEELLDGRTVEGVAGIGPDGRAMAPTSRRMLRQRGKVLVAVSAVLLLIEAVIADGIASALLYAWTAIGLSLFLVGCYCIMLKE
jgi:hypothetical protein